MIPNLEARGIVGSEKKQALNERELTDNLFHGCDDYEEGTRHMMEQCRAWKPIGPVDVLERSSPYMQNTEDALIIDNTTHKYNI